MIDRDQLREALEWWDREARFDPHFMLQGFDTFIEAARLVAEGREVWWCEEHDDKAGSEVVQVKGMEPVGMCHWYSLTPSEGQERCRMVRMILIDGGES